MRTIITLASEASTNFCTSLKVLSRSAAVMKSGADVDAGDDVDVGDDVIGHSVVVAVVAVNLLCCIK